MKSKGIIELSMVIGQSVCNFKGGAIFWSGFAMVNFQPVSTAVELEIPVDHIHMVVRTDPKISPAYVMQVIKSIRSVRRFN